MPHTKALGNYTRQQITINLLSPIISFDMSLSVLCLVNYYGCLVVVLSFLNNLRAMCIQITLIMLCTWYRVYTVSVEKNLLTVKRMSFFESCDQLTPVWLASDSYPYFSRHLVNDSIQLRYGLVRVD